MVAPSRPYRPTSNTLARASQSNGAMADATRGDLLAYVADIAIELSVLSAAKGFDALGAKFLEAAAEARRRRADHPPSDHEPKAAPADAT